MQLQAMGLSDPFACQAYSLVQNDRDVFGKEAVDTLNLGFSWPRAPPHS